MPKWRTTRCPNLILLTRRELQTRSSRPSASSARMRRRPAEQRRRTETANSQEGCRCQSQQDETCDQETDKATDLHRPAQPPRGCDDRRAASGDRLAATQCARLPGWGRQKEARPHSRIGEAGRGTPPLSHFERGLIAMGRIARLCRRSQRAYRRPAKLAATRKATDGAARDTEVSRMLEALPALSPDELRKEWRRLYRSQPPRLSRDLLVRAIAYRIQELRYGGLSKATSRKLAALVQARQSDGGDSPRGRPEDQSGRAVGA